MERYDTHSTYALKPDYGIKAKQQLMAPLSPSPNPGAAVDPERVAVAAARIDLRPFDQFALGQGLHCRRALLRADITHDVRFKVNRNSLLDDHVMYLTNAFDDANVALGIIGFQACRLIIRVYMNDGRAGRRTGDSLGNNVRSQHRSIGLHLRSP